MLTDIDTSPSEEPVADVVERLELELDKEFAECEQALIDIDTNYTGLEARAEEEELAEDLKILELKTDISGRAKRFCDFRTERIICRYYQHSNQHSAQPSHQQSKHYYFRLFKCRSYYHHQ